MLRSVIATALALCVSVAIGCSKRNEKPAAPGTPPDAKTQATTTVPVDEKNKKIDTTIPLPQPFYESAQVGAAVKPDGTIEDVRDEFTPSEHLYISVKARQVPAGLAANLAIRNSEKEMMVDTRSEFSPATSRAVFPVTDLSKWKPGLYDIEVTMEGDVVFKHGVHIKGKSGAKSSKQKGR